MNFKVQQSALLKALTAAGKCIGSSVLDILNSYLFTIDGNSLSVTGGDMNVFLTSSLQIEGGDFKKIIAIPKSRLLDLVKDLPDQSISFSITERKSKTVTSITLKIKHSFGECELPVEPGEDYPMIKMVDPVSFSMYAESLMVGIDKTLFASHTDTTNALGGVHVAIEGKEIHYASSNTWILSTMTYDLEEELPSNTKILVPAKVLGVLRTISYDEHIEVSICEKAIKFIVNESTVVYSMLVENKFPAYQNFIPQGYTNHLAIDKQLLLGSMKRVSNFSVDDNNTIVAELTDTALKISSRNDLGQKAFEELPVDYKGSPLSISLNGKNLVLCLNRLSTDKVHMSFNNEKMPALLREDDSDLNGQKNLMMVMPIVFKEKE